MGGTDLEMWDEKGCRKEVLQDTISLLSEVTAGVTTEFCLRRGPWNRGRR